MARRLGRRKMPDRNRHTEKEADPTEGGVFNTKSMLSLHKLFNKHIIEKIEFPISTGKEADVYLAIAGSAEKVSDARFVALKFFRVESQSFGRMKRYIAGDPRFGKVRKGRITMINTWCEKEFWNLRIARKAGARVPEPYFASGSILAMEFIGDENGRAAPRLKEAVIEEPESMLDGIVRQAALLYSVGLVHADLSEFNVLIMNGKPYLIDIGQGVTLNHPEAGVFIRKDMENITRYFALRYGTAMSAERALELVTSKRRRHR